MKLNLNLPLRAPWRAAPVIAVTCGLACVCVALAAWLLHTASAMRDETPVLASRLEQTLQALRQMQAVASASALPTDLSAALPADNYASVREQVRFLNSVSSVGGWHTPELLSWLERHLPADVRLVSLQHRTREGEILLAARSTRVEPLTAFLIALESEPHFAQVLLSRQERRLSAGGEAIFEFRIKER